MENQENAQVALSEREVLVYSTVGQSISRFKSNARTWSELQSNLSAFQVDFNKMKAVVGNNKNTLESPDAMLPQENFTLFLMPMKTKAGKWLDRSYKEARTEIKSIIDNASDVNSAKEHFSESNRNYTQTSTADMNKNLKSWYDKTSEKVSSNVDNVVDAVAKKANMASKAKKIDEDSTIFTEAISVVSEIKTKFFTVEETREWKTIIQDLRKLEKTVIERIAQENLDKQLKNDLLKEAKDLAKGFGDIGRF